MRSITRLFICLMSLVVSAVAVRADDFPTRPITIVVGFSPGAIVDLVVRAYAEELGKVLGQSVLIENKAGGGGIIATSAVQHARPDGYTLLLTDIGAHGILPALQDVPYKSVKDLAPITLLFEWPQYLVVPTRVPANTVPDLLAYGRSKPGGLILGSQGVGSGGHLLGAMFRSKSGVPLRHIPYQGAAPLSRDLVAGEVDLAFVSYASLSAPLKAGAVKVLAIAAPKRSTEMPKVPTLDELGLPDIHLDAWFGLSAPAGTPRAIIDRLDRELVKISNNPDFVRRITAHGVVVKTDTPEEFTAFITAEQARFKPIAKAAMADSKP